MTQDELARHVVELHRVVDVLAAAVMAIGCELDLDSEKTAALSIGERLGLVAPYGTPIEDVIRAALARASSAERAVLL